MAKKPSFHIGTSGWSYSGWKGSFYPEDCPQKAYLSYYSEHFETVEVNNSFYHLPSAETFEQWRKTVGKNFVFAVKASRYITHMKKLKEPKEGLSNFFGAAEALKAKFGPVLFQLPPRWHVNAERLAAFLDALPARGRYTFEFRDKSWFNDQVFDLLAAHGAALCIYDLEGQVSPEIVTAGFVYVRLHGPDPNAYQGSYTPKHLRALAKRCRGWMEDGKEVFCYFDNDQKGYAIKNALSLRDLL